jgi:hypothetical protein
LANRLGIAQRTYKAYLEFLTSPRFLRAANAGARPQRLLWASTGTKDPKASDILYVKGLAAPFTINTMPENTRFDSHMCFNPCDTFYARDERLSFHTASTPSRPKPGGQDCRNCAVQQAVFHPVVCYPSVEHRRQ